MVALLPAEDNQQSTISNQQLEASKKQLTADKQPSTIHSLTQPADPEQLAGHSKRDLTAAVATERYHY